MKGRKRNIRKHTKRKRREDGKHRAKLRTYSTPNPYRYPFLPQPTLPPLPSPSPPLNLRNIFRRAGRRGIESPGNPGTLGGEPRQMTRVPGEPKQPGGGISIQSYARARTPGERGNNAVPTTHFYLSSPHLRDGRSRRISRQTSALTASYSVMAPCDKASPAGPRLGALAAALLQRADHRGPTGRERETFSEEALRRINHKRIVL